MIIVEGPDNSGKSTLVRQLAEEVKLLSVANKRKPKTKQEAFDFLNLAIPLSKKFPTIFDRWTPISEMVYGPVVRGETVFSLRDIEIARAAPLLANLHPLIIYCRPDDDTIAATIEARNQMEGVASNLDKIIKGYDDVIGSWSLAPANSYPTVRYNYREPLAYDRVISRVHDHFKEFQ